MATERIQIIVEERGTRVVKRQLESLGTTAKTSSRGVGLLTTALAAVGGFTLARGLLRTADAFVEINNRIRVAQNGTGNVSQAFERLFAVSQKTRAPLEAMAQLYARAGLAANELGASQADLIQLTENVGLALAIQGGSTEAARGALLQLSQALGSGIVRAEEFNSILEGALPIAQAAARGIDQAGGSVAQLRLLVLEGKITSDVFFRGLLSQTDSLQEQFNNTTATLRQQLIILRNAFIRFIGELDSGLGVTRSLGQAIGFLGRNLADVARVAIVAGVAFGTLQLAPLVGRAVAAANAFIALRIAVASGGAVMLGSAEATRQKTIAEVQGIQASIIRTKTTIAQTQAEALLATTIMNSNTAALAQAAAQSKLTALKAQQIVQTDALAAANLRLATAQKAAAFQSTMLGRALVFVKVQTVALLAVIAANPLGAILVGLGTVTALLTVYSDRIRLASDATTTLRDVGLAVFDEFRFILQDVVNVVGEVVGSFTPLDGVFDGIQINLRSVLTFAAKAADLFAGSFVGAFMGLGRLFQELPNLIVNTTTATVNGAISLTESLINLTIRGINELVLGSIVGLNALITLANSASSKLGGGDLLKTVDAKGLRIKPVEFKRLESDLGGAAANFSEAVIGGFKEGLQLTTGVQDLLGRALENADLKASQRDAEAALAAIAAAEGTSAPREKNPLDRDAFSPGDLAGLITLNQELDRQAEVLGLLSRERDIANKMSQIENQLLQDNIFLTEEQRSLFESRLLNLQALNDQAELLDAIRGPQIEFAAQQAALNVLFTDGKISVEEYQTALKDMQLTALDSATSVEAGFQRGFIRLNDQINDFASTAETGLTNAFNSAEDALVEFVTTGEFNFSKLVDSILSDIARLLVQQAISGLLGAATGGAAGFSGGIGSFLFGGGKAAGGPVEPGKSYLVGERGPEIVNMGAPGNVVPAGPTAAMLGNQPPPQVNVQVVNVSDPNEVSSALNTQGVQDQVVNVIRKNRSAVRAALGV